MKKMLAAMLLMSLLSVSCGGGGGGGGGNGSTSNNEVISMPSDGELEPDTASGEDASLATSVPTLARTFKTNVKMYDFTGAQEDKYEQAVALVKKVVATSAFRSRVLNFKYNGKKQYVNNNGRTNAQIYQSILDAAEKLKSTKNNTLDLGVKMYYEDNSVVGWTNAKITYINVNTKFFNRYDINEVAGNLFHEWLHKLGYGHDAEVTARRPYSVPYAIGYMVRDIGKNFL